MIDSSLVFFGRLLLVLLLLFCCANAATKPNVILITLDTVRADRMGFLGSKLGLTPHLDSLARESMIFERAYAQAPLTTVSHASILTGTYPQFHNVNDFGIPLPSDVPTIAELLRRQGYATAAFVGSLILDPRNGFAPGFDRGFQTFDAGYRIRRADDDRYATMERRAAQVISRATRWVRKQQRPFFIWVHLFDAHDPYDPPAPYASRFKANPYNGEIAYVDATLGTFFQTLRQAGLFSDSLIVLTSDHGEALGNHGELTHGIFLYDETIHVPLLVKLPANLHPRIAPGRRTTVRVELIDILPTIVEITRAKLPAAAQGRSLVNQPDDDRSAYAETDYPRRAFGWSPLRALRRGNYLFVKAPRPELYDQNTDPGAQKNLATTSKAVAESISSQLDQQRERTARSPSTTSTISAEQASSLAALGYLANASPGSAVSATGADPKDKIDVANALHRAILLTEDAKYEEAFPLLQQVLKDDPQIYIAQLQLGIAFARRKDYANALAPLGRAVALRTDSAIAQTELGVALFETGDWNAAGTHFEQAVKLLPKSADAHFSLASVYARTQRVPEALNELRTALELHPEHYRANLLYGRLLALQDHPSEALPYLQKAAEVQPNSVDAHRFLLEVFTTLRKTSDAERERSTLRALQREGQANH